MSEFKTCFTKIIEVNPHPNPEVLRLEIATVYGFQVVIPKGRYNVGDFAFFIPVDAVLPSDLEEIIFPVGSKIKLHNSRVKQIRIQKFPSQGMLVDVAEVQKYAELKKIKLTHKLEEDLKDVLGIVKYEPPAPSYHTPGQKKDRNRPLENSKFHKYNGLENIKWYPNLFTEGENVIIQEKLHGSNCRAGILPTEANTLLKKIKKFFGLLPKFERVYGSNNVELTNRAGYTGFYGEDVYGNVLKKVDAFSKLKDGEIIFGELIGEGIQKNYHYGHKQHHFVLFDVKVMNLDTKEFRWLTPDEVDAFAKERGFDVVPTLYKGPFSKQIAYELTKGDSVYCPAQKIREGVVIKSIDEYNNQNCPSGKKTLKYISEAYLDKDQTDFH